MSSAPRARLRAVWGQLYTAFSGDVHGGQQIQQVGDIVSGPLLGVPTLIATQNPAKAQKMANAESFLTAGAGLINSNKATQAIKNGVDFGLSAMGLAGGGCE